MSFRSLIDSTISEHQEVIHRFQEECASVIDEMAQATVKALQAGNKICFCGNGGSAADSQHLATEFVVRFTRNRQALPSLAFTTDTSGLTACANDFGFDEVFARQVEGLCVAGDIVVGISTSGTSPNVIRALEEARKKQVITFAFTGESGGDCNDLADYVLKVPSKVTARVQEFHILAGHILCDIGEEQLAESTS